MDPDAALYEIRRLVEQVLEEQDLTFDTVDTLAERVQELDLWLAKGGFLPTRWASAKTR